MTTLHPRFLRTVGVAGALCAATGACSLLAPREPEPPVLVDATDRVRLEFVHDCGAQPSYFMPALMGPGVALLDYDGDGDLDLYLLNCGPPRSDRLFRQEHDGTFADATAEAGLGSSGCGMGVAVGDYDNDGAVDVYVTSYGENRLFHNRGDGTFADVTEPAGVGDDSWSTSAAFLDYDADGWLDLYVAHYLRYDPGMECPAPTGRLDFCPPALFEGLPDRLYHNNGDGTFADVSAASGIDEIARKGLGVVAHDFNGDDRLDIFVANDQEPNTLWVNRGDGTFRDEGVIRGVAFNAAGAALASMGVALGDLDNDLDFDLYVTNLRGEANTAYLNDAGAFRDATAELGLHVPSLPFTGFGVAAVDLEHDGDLDLVAVNGHVYRASPEPGAARGPFWNDYAQPGVVLRNEGGGRFVDVSRSVGSFGTVPEVGRGLAVGDIDGDGDVDFVLGNSNGRARLFLNESPKQGHWLAVRAWDESLRRDAIGAVITLTAGARRFVALADPATGYLSSNDPQAHFGLGNAARVELLEVRWPGGGRERFPGTEADRVIRLVRGQGISVEPR